MKRCLPILICCLLGAAACGSEPATVDDRNQQGVTKDQPAAASSPAGSSEEEAKLAGANYPEMVKVIHQRINEYRQSQGLEPLQLNPLISEEAREHSVEMSQNPNTISHRQFDDRIADLRGQLPYRAAAEIVGANLNYENPGAEAVEGWINSPGHRKNIVGDYDQTGIGIAQAENGRYFFTQIFWRTPQ